MMKLSIKLAILFLFFIGISGAYSQHRIGHASWQYYLKKGKLQVVSQIYNEAIINLKKALEIKPDLAEAAELLGDIHVIKNKRLEALHYYRRALEINDSQPDLHNKIAELYDFHAEYDQALFHYTRAVELKHDHVKANNNLVRFYIKQGKHELAQIHFSVSYNAGRDEALPFYQKALEAKSRGHIQESNDLYSQAIEKSPAMIEAYMGLYENYRRMEKYKEAVIVLEKVIYIKPDFEPAYLALGHLYFDRGFPRKSRKYCIEKALKNFTVALNLNPQNAHTAYSLADIYRIIGDDLKAEEYYNRARSLEENVRPSN